MFISDKEEIFSESRNLLSGMAIFNLPLYCFNCRVLFLTLNKLTYLDSEQAIRSHSFRLSKCEKIHSICLPLITALHLPVPIG